MSRHSIRLTGPAATGAKVSAALLKDLLDVLVEGCRRSLRLRVEGRSSTAGAPPGWLVEAADFEVLNFREGSTVIDVEAPPLCQAAPATFRQGDFFIQVDTSKSALALFEESLDDALGGNLESDLYDDCLVDTVEQFARVLGERVETIQITNGKTRIIQRDGLTTLGKIRRQTPAPQQVRVAGKIDSIRHSTKTFTLVLESGETINGVAVGVEAQRLADLFGKTALVAGKAVFRPSGSILRIEAERMEPGTGDVSVWAKAPTPVLGEIDTKALHRGQGPRSGLSAIFGKWPGDESDEEIAAALETLS